MRLTDPPAPGMVKEGQSGPVQMKKEKKTNHTSKLTEAKKKKRRQTYPTNERLCHRKGREGKGRELPNANAWNISSI